jgi:cell division protein FtsZ
MTIIEAFKISDSVLIQGVQGISDLIVQPGLINVDFADVRAIMKDAGTALMGIGIGTGEHRAEESARAAISSPLLEQSIEGAAGILFNIIGGTDLTMKEVDKAATIISQVASPDANIIFGATIDDKLKGQIKITVIATGFNTGDIKKQLGFRPEYKEPREIRYEFPKPEEDNPQKPDDFKPQGPSEEGGEYDSKYDIPAFLRGK